MTGDDIEVIDIDGEPTAVTVKNAKAPGDTIIVQTDTGEEHIVKKQAVSGTPQMEELHNMYEAAMGEARFDVVLRTPDDDMESVAAENVSMKEALKAVKGQLQMFHDMAIQGDGDPNTLNIQRTSYRPKVNGTPMRLPEWMIKDEITGTISYLVVKPAGALSEADGEMKGLFIPVSANSKTTRTYLPRSIRAILKKHGVKITGKTSVSKASDSIFSDGVVVRISGLEFPHKGRDLNVAKAIYDELRYVGYNVEDYPTFVQGGINVFVNNENPDGRTAMKVDEAADKIKPINKMGYAPKAGSWKRRMHKAQPPENHEKTKKRHKKLREEDPEGAEEREAFKQKLKDPTQYYIRRVYHIGKKQYDDFPAEVLAVSDRKDSWTGHGHKARFVDNKGEEHVAWYPEPGKGSLSGRYYDEHLVKKGEKPKFVAGDSRNEWPAVGEKVEEEFRNTIFDKEGDHVGTPLGNGIILAIQPMDDHGNQLVRVKMDKYKDHDGDSFTFNAGDLTPPKGDENLSRMRQLAGIKETASGGATGAGAIASAPAAVGDMHSRNPGIYGKTTEKPKKKKRTKENKSDGIGRSRKE